MEEKIKHRILLHRKYWKQYGKKKYRRKFKDVSKNLDTTCKKIRFYDYLD